MNEKGRIRVLLAFDATNEPHQKAQKNTGPGGDVLTG
jgi:hypothetical protein